MIGVLGETHKYLTPSGGDSSSRNAHRARIAQFLSEVMEKGTAAKAAEIRRPDQSFK